MRAQREAAADLELRCRLHKLALLVQNQYVFSAQKCDFTLNPRIFAKTGSGQTQDKLVEKKRLRFCRTYDSNDVQPDWYGMIDDNGAIDAVLAPKAHPDPCKMPAQ
eukprot:COSAG06_NODE_1602_length_8958_cov_85.920194_9_plen_106_part_00